MSRHNTYSTHQVPLLLEQWIGKIGVEAGVAVVESRLGGHLPQRSEFVVVQVVRRVVPFPSHSLVLLLRPPDLKMQRKKTHQ